MRSAGYELGSALTFLVVVNLGTTVGPLLVGLLADRLGSKPAIIVSFLLAAAGIATMSRTLPGPVLYVVAVLAGVGIVDTQILVNVFIAGRYPVEIRATAIGTALSLGRPGGILGPLYGGLLLSLAWPAPALFLAFAAPAVLGALLVVAVPRPAATTVERSPRAGRDRFRQAR